MGFITRLLAAELANDIGGAVLPFLSDRRQDAGQFVNQLEKAIVLW